MDPLVARKTWRTLEPLHGMIYFAPDTEEPYRSAGLGGHPESYFASRSAVFGTPTAEVVIATFFNFYPPLVRRAMDGVWDRVSAADVLAARLEGADRALRRTLGEEAVGSAPMAEAADLARRAAEAAGGDLGGRPLFAAHASQPWPSAPHLVLFWAQTLLREYRGDGHIAALVAAGLGPVEALISHAASGEVPVGALRATREWPERDWAAGEEALRRRGLLDDAGQLTETGTALRREIEDRTDRVAVGAYEVLGDEGCARLRTLCRPFSQAVVAAGLLSPATRTAG